MGNITLKTRLQAVGLTGTLRYITKPVQYSRINERELMQMAAENSGVNIAMIRATFDAMVIQMKEILLNGHSINIEGLGTFKFSIRCKSCESPLDITLHNVKRRRINFRPSSELHSELQRLGKTIVIEKKKEEVEEEGD